MSQIKFDCALTIIPVDTQFVPNEDVSQSALVLLEKLFPYAEEYRYESFDSVRFISPEMFAFSAICPVCGVETTRGNSRDEPGRIWFSEVDRVTNQAVQSFKTTLPDCGHAVPFCELRFNCPAGFARFALTARFSYFDERLMSDEMQQSDEVESLRQLLGVPVKVVRTYYAFLPSDRQKIEGLMSDDDDERVAAAQALDAVGPSQFEEHNFCAMFIEDNAERLLSSFRDSKHNSVKDWILFLLAYAEFVNQEILEIVSSELKPDSALLNQVLYLIFRNPKHFQHLKSEIVLLTAHDDSQVRWRCALALRYLSLNYDDDGELLRKLMVDDYYATRQEAVLCFQKLIGRTPVSDFDRVVLQQVVDIDPLSSAAFYAKELLVAEST